MRLRLCLLSGAFVLASCGGGGGSSSLPNGAPAAAPSATASPRATAAPTTAPTAGPTPAPTLAPSANTVKMTLTFSRGSRAAHVRHPHFISPSSQSIVVTVNSVNGGSPPSWVSPNPVVTNLVTASPNPNCTVAVPTMPADGATETCTINVYAPPGSVNYTFSLYDNTNGNGNLLGTKTATFTIAQGQTNTLSVGFQGVVSWVSFSAGSLSPSTDTPGQSSSEPLYVYAYDEDDNQIVGSSLGTTNFNNPIALGVNDPSNAITLSVGSSPSCPGSTSVTVNSPADNVWVCYTGEATWGGSLSAAEADGGPAGESITGEGSVSTSLNSIQLAGTTLCDTTAGCATTDPNYLQQTVFLQYPGTTQSFSASELGWTQSPYNGQFDLSLDATTCGSGQSAIVSVSSGPATAWTITPNATGICQATITEHGNNMQSATVWLSVTSAQVQGFSRPHAR